jgi:hypothetical protein
MSIQVGKMRDRCKLFLGGVEFGSEDHAHCRPRIFYCSPGVYKAGDASCAAYGDKQGRQVEKSEDGSIAQEGTYGTCDSKDNPIGLFHTVSNLRIRVEWRIETAQMVPGKAWKESKKLGKGSGGICLRGIFFLVQGLSFTLMML